ncbi:MAG: hypothetical protein ABI855_06140 [Bacteroidota bacterium]
MMEQNSITRRMLVKSSVFGLLGATVPNIMYSRDILTFVSENQDKGSPHDRYPAILLEVASEVVGVSHFNLVRLKEIVDPRPELAKASWDWGFGDWESAIAAASHVGRKDIVEYLISKGAVPTIFTFAMLGAYDSVKIMVDFYPGIQKNFGPHGISLLQHAKLGLLTEGNNKSKARQLIDYLEASGDADGKSYLTVEEVDKEKYLGDYKYGDGKDDGFTIKLNMKKLLSLGKIGKSGGALYKTGENEFTYNAAPSVTINFKIENSRVISMTVNEPGLVLNAVKILQ